MDTPARATSNGREHGVVRSRARLALRAGGWLLAYFLVLQLVLTGIATGVMAATPAPGSFVLCTAQGTPEDDHSGTGGPGLAHGVPHCVLCPLAGLTPLLPDGPRLPVRTIAAHLAPAVVGQAAPALVRHEALTARPRAPPLPA